VYRLDLYRIFVAADIVADGPGYIRLHMMSRKVFPLSGVNA
jgi:hypothetical protein